ncbi:hypothetical protein QQS21_003606 [Conoideocrella luteorostrata]|uniref:FAD-binding PCMH-type domain-containing protein n=1 Tax=Conoideocrella luteorostrata TaxID=1105319 RepID=A0AAJ0CVT5_9HYPO|nr:hypothetical protein QQS21_003606 [Conoideocrella luteorostrata]
MHVRGGGREEPRIALLSDFEKAGQQGDGIADIDADNTPGRPGRRPVLQRSPHPETFKLNHPRLRVVNRALQPVFYIILCLLAILCLANVPIVAKNIIEWRKELKSSNRRVSFVPAVVVVPRSTEHIQAAVSCGNENNVRVTAKGGGHSFGSFGLGGENGHLVLSMDRMRPLLTEVAPGMKLVIANGSVIHCSQSQNSDLFWALRGAGSSFGIVSELEFNTIEAPKDIVHFSIRPYWDQQAAVKGIKGLQEFIKLAPKELNLMLIMYGHSQILECLYFGHQAGLERLVTPLLQSIGAPRPIMAKLEWMRALEHFAYGEALAQTDPASRSQSFYATSAFTKALGEAQVETLMSKMFAHFTNPHNIIYTLELYGGQTSAVRNVENLATSFSHRAKLLLHQLRIQVPDNDSHSLEKYSLIESFRDSVTHLNPEGDWGMYANYLDTELDSEVAQKLYWGDSLPRLRSIKAEFNPNDLFWNPQGVR